MLCLDDHNTARPASTIARWSLPQPSSIGAEDTPTRLRSITRSTSPKVMQSRSSRTDKIAASFISAANDAPEYPSVSSAVRFKSASVSHRASPTDGTLSFRACTFRMLSRSLCFFGTPMWKDFSNLPDRSNAGSSCELKFVAPITSTISCACPAPALVSNPSSSINSCINPASRSSVALSRLLYSARLRPMVSSSSIKIIAGDTSRARLNKSRTRFAATPTNISTNSEPFA
mmetsp:Transcript_2733/g.9552  ORF Transcript_2733/g.9552 Transcript_2733/m.9552 type:complete len:231 (-) Transcript_2733:2070-2762(-)